MNRVFFSAMFEWLAPFLLFQVRCLQQPLLVSAMFHCLRFRYRLLCFNVSLEYGTDCQTLVQIFSETSNFQLVVPIRIGRLRCLL